MVPEESPLEEKESEPLFLSLYIRVSSGLLFIFGGVLLSLPVLYRIFGLTDLLGYGRTSNISGWFYHQIWMVVISVIFIVTAYGLKNRKTWGTWLGLFLTSFSLTVTALNLVIYGFGDFDVVDLLIKVWMIFLFIALFLRLNRFTSRP